MRHKRLPSLPPFLELLASSYRDDAERDSARENLKIGLIEIAAKSPEMTALRRANDAEDLFSAAVEFVDRQLAMPNSRCRTDWPASKRHDNIGMALWLARLAVTCPGSSATERIRFAAELCHLVGSETGAMASCNFRIVAMHTLETRMIPRKFITYHEALQRVAHAKGDSISSRRFKDLWVEAVLRELEVFDAWPVERLPPSIKEIGWKLTYPTADATERGDWVDVDSPEDVAHRERCVKANLQAAFNERRRAGTRRRNGNAAESFEEYVIDRIVQWRRHEGRKRS